MLLRTLSFVIVLAAAYPAFADTVPSADPAISNQNQAAPTMPAQASPLTQASSDGANAAAAPQTSVAIPSVAAAGASESAPVAPASPVVYIKPTFSDVVQAMVRFNALDLHDDKIVDEYAKVTDCEIFQYYNKDDFKWNEVRKKIRASVDLNQEKYPVHFYFLTVLLLDRYDFDRKMYRFMDSSAIKNINVFNLYSVQGPICGSPLEHLPTIYQGVADVPFSLAGLPLSPSDAQTLLREMNADKNKDRTVIGKFDMTVTYVDKLRKSVVEPGAHAAPALYFQAPIKGQAPGSKAFRLDVHLDDVSFYEDIELKKLVYSTKP